MCCGCSLGYPHSWDASQWSLNSIQLEQRYNGLFQSQVLIVPLPPVQIWKVVCTTEMLTAFAGGLFPSLCSLILIISVLFRPSLYLQFTVMITVHIYTIIIPSDFSFSFAVISSPKRSFTARWLPLLRPSFFKRVISASFFLALHQSSIYTAAAFTWVIHVVCPAMPENLLSDIWVLFLHMSHTEYLKRIQSLHISNTILK